MSIKRSECLEWDTATWSRALQFWEENKGDNSAWAGKYGLELGAHRGGLSLYFAQEWGCRMLCSDLIYPDKAEAWHAAFAAPDGAIEYAAVDALQIPFPDATFDMVVFKSMLGIIGRNRQPEKMEYALREMYRVLKPGGYLFFAENLHGSLLHRLARRYFVRWGDKWYYPQYEELEQMLRMFPQKQLKTTGFFAAFIPGNRPLKNLAAILDSLLFFVPKSWQYVGYGMARKEG
jgi:ubiquinone/menaquinone biosynthesis C-methylase UbiE